MRAVKPSCTPGAMIGVREERRDRRRDAAWFRGMMAVVWLCFWSEVGGMW